MTPLKIGPLKIARTAGSKAQLPKTKKPFAAFLDTLPPNKQFEPAGQSHCFLAEFMRARLKKVGANIYMNTERYAIDGNSYVLPAWAQTFTRQTHAATQPGTAHWNTWPCFEKGHPLTVAKAKKLLEAVA